MFGRLARRRVGWPLGGEKRTKRRCGAISPEGTFDSDANGRWDGAPRQLQSLDFFG